MTRKGAAVLGVAVATLLGVAGGWVATAEGAYTWEGVWSSTFGDITMNAGGSGTYPGGMISGRISGPDGRTNSGTWQESSTNGNYVFNMFESGRAFDGTYERTGGGCVFPPCDWDGFACLSGSCLQNAVVDPKPCREGRDDCLYEIRFGFELKRGLPTKPPKSELPGNLISVQAHTDDARLFSNDPTPSNTELLANGILDMTTRYRKAGGGIDKDRSIFGIGREGRYDREPGEVIVGAQMGLHEANAGDENCPGGVASFMELETRKLKSGKKVIKLSIRSRRNDVTDERIACLTDSPNGALVWVTNDFNRVSIGRPRLIKSD